MPLALAHCCATLSPLSTMRAIHHTPARLGEYSASATPRRTPQTNRGPSRAPRAPADARARALRFCAGARC